MLLVEKDGAVAVVTINRPEAMNALSKAVRTALHDAMVALNDAPDVSVVILTGAGQRAFTAGIDLKELGGNPAGIQVPDSDEGDPLKAIEACAKPVIGAINGVAITGGFELALACDVLIASENARFADTHARVGVMPGWGLSQKLSRLIGPYRAKELSLSGNFLDAATARDWGLVNRVVPADELMGVAHQLARDMATIPNAFLQRYKRLIDDGYALPYGEGLALERQRSGAYNKTVTAQALKTNRGQVQARGRSQS
jgi:enoyl-CoA hydratase